MVPKLVHYIWVGPNEIAPKNAELISRNSRFLRDYEIRIWREPDIDLSSDFVKRALEARRWAFVSDYVRFQLLRDHGGIYLDTDMELLKSIDPLLGDVSFAGKNRSGDKIYCGIIGAAPHFPLFQDVLDAYDALPENEWPTSPEILTKVYKSGHYDDLKLYDYRVFYPVDEGMAVDPNKLKDAFATHHWDESWRSAVPLRRLLRRVGVIPLYHFFIAKFRSASRHRI